MAPRPPASPKNFSLSSSSGWRLFCYNKCCELRAKLQIKILVRRDESELGDRSLLATTEATPLQKTNLDALMSHKRQTAVQMNLCRRNGS